MTKIQCSITDAARYRDLSPAFARAIDWLMEHNPADVAPGRYDIGLGVTVNCEEPRLRSASNARLEAHRRYADIHVPISGPEGVGMADIGSLSCPTADYDADRDIIFFADSYSDVTEIIPGEMLILFPEDAHAPNIGEGPHRKLCIKIPI